MILKTFCLQDDLTGDIIKNGGWTLTRNNGGEERHLQNLQGVVELVLSKEHGFGGGTYVRELLVRKGIIGPVPYPDRLDDRPCPGVAASVCRRTAGCCGC